MSATSQIQGTLVDLRQGVPDEYFGRLETLYEHLQLASVDTDPYEDIYAFASRAVYFAAIISKGSQTPKTPSSESSRTLQVGGGNAKQVVPDQSWPPQSWSTSNVTSPTPPRKRQGRRTPSSKSQPLVNIQPSRVSHPNLKLTQEFTFC